jgi:hypothetical protein
MKSGGLSASAERVLQTLGSESQAVLKGIAAERHASDITRLLQEDLLAVNGEKVEVTPVGRAYLARRGAAQSASGLDPFLVQHIEPAARSIVLPEGRMQIQVNEAESPLAWLARRKGRDGQPLIASAQLLAGERLRAEFTRAELTPRVTSNWSGAVDNPATSASSATDATIAARQRVRRALDAVGPEFAGLLLDVCCFLKGLADVERERRWPARSAKVVLQLGLDRLARHYGLAQEARGPKAAAVRTWLAPDAKFSVG